MIQMAELLVEGLDGEAAARMLQERSPTIRRTRSRRRCSASSATSSSKSRTTRRPAPPATRRTTRRTRRSAGLTTGGAAPVVRSREIGPEGRGEPLVLRTRAFARPRLRRARRWPAPSTRSTTVRRSAPSYPLDGAPESEPSSSYAARPVAPPEPEPEPEPAPLDAERTPELESALEEAESSRPRGLFDDARTILHEQLARLPNNPLVQERLTELDAHRARDARRLGTRGVSLCGRGL